MHQLVPDAICNALATLPHGITYMPLYGAYIGSGEHWIYTHVDRGLHCERGHIRCPVIEIVPGAGDSG